jgi:hypothetical protein
MTSLREQDQEDRSTTRPDSPGVSGFSRAAYYAIAMQVYRAMHVCTLRHCLAIVMRRRRRQ